ncbi:MAG: ATPase, T2SS/T4P/T4SS family [Patescibacteria group bacterium]
MVDAREIERAAALQGERTVSSFIKRCFAIALKQGASDIHFQPVRDGLLIRLRTHGIMADLVQLPVSDESTVINYIKTLADMDVNERRKPTDGRFFYEHEGDSFDIRVSTTPVYERGGREDGLCRQRVVLRILDHRSIEIPLSELGLLPHCQEMLGRALYKRSGLILCTGPVGSGKTTLLYAMMRSIASSALNLLVVGDPPEYELDGVSQGAVSKACDFAAFVKSFLRQDPDVLMVGEIRGEDTANVVTDAAIMGHLILSSLHTKSSSIVPYRLNRLGVDSALISEGLNLVVNQRLVRQLCPDCRIRQDKQTPASWVELEEIQRGAVAVGASYGQTDTTIECYSPGGTRDGQPCGRCKGSGFIGRIGVFEVLDASKIADVLRTSIDQPSLVMEAALQRDAIWPLAADAMAKVFDGIITLDDAKAICIR